jgi:hypothetical protein
VESYLLHEYDLENHCCKNRRMECQGEAMQTAENNIWIQTEWILLRHIICTLHIILLE